MNRTLPAFSLFEMLFVLAIISLIILVPKLFDSSLLRAKIQIVNDLRLVRNLATKDDRQALRDFGKVWDTMAQAEVQNPLAQTWRLQFHSISNRVEGYIGATYSIFAKRPRRNGEIDNKPMGFVSIAKNPYNARCLSWYNFGDLPIECRNIRDERLRLEEKFGITNVRFVWNTKGCTAVHKTLYFDSLGQIYCGSSRLIKASPNAQIMLEGRRGNMTIQLSEL